LINEGNKTQKLIELSLIYFIMEDENNSSKRFSKFDKKLYIIFLIQFTEVSGFALVIPILPFIGLDLGLNEFEIGIILSIFSICQLFASPITGKLSDRYGRKPLLIFSQISTFTGFLLLGFANNVMILIIARLIDGLFGSNMTVANACISDLTTNEERTKAYSYSSGVFGAGLIVGPAIGGLLAQINLAIPMFFAAGISLLSIILVLIYLQETNPYKSDKLELKFSEILPIKDLNRFFKTKLSRNILILFSIYMFGFMLFVNNLSLYVVAMYDVTVEYAAYLRTWVGILRVILQTFIVDKIIHSRGEIKILLSGFITLFIAMVSMIIISNELLVFIPLILISYGSGVSRPILTSRLTKTVSDKEFATILGVNEMLISISRIISPILGGALILYISHLWVTGLAALMFLIVIILMVFLKIKE
jgi:DHA1 family tetracycline resistance protein-like MFS transporter